MAGSSTAAMTANDLAGASSTAMSSSSPSRQQAPAVSATKKRSVPRGNTRSPITQGIRQQACSPHGELCIALYHPKPLRKQRLSQQQESSPSSTRGIWWPALRFPSIQAFQRSLEANLLRDGRSVSGSSKSLEWSSLKKKKRHRKRLVQKVLREALGETPVEALCYLGRPLEDYVTADEAAVAGVEVQEFTPGLFVLTRQAKERSFPGEFLSVCGEEQNALTLFRDFYDAMDEAMARHSRDDSDNDSSDSDDSDEESISAAPQAPLRSWASKAQKFWDDYQRNPTGSSSNDRNNSEPSPQPLPPPREGAPEDEPMDNEVEAPQARPPHDDASIAAQSAAAVSCYTEASLASASKGLLAPPALAEEEIREGDDFETIWEKHQMEGWDHYVLEDEENLGAEKDIYEAPNGYKFESHRAFCEYLTETYGFCGEPPVPEQAEEIESKKPRGRSIKRSFEASSERSRSSSRSRSRSRSREGRDELSFPGLWKYLRSSLGWNYDWASKEDMKVFGMSTTALFFRPGYNKKNKGNHGEDYFVSEDEVYKYCLERNIRPPPPTPAAAKDPPQADDDASEAEDSQPAEASEVDESENDDDDDESTEVPSDDPGYNTPDDQSTVPQDPGKPRLPSPPGSDSSGETAGSWYSYDNDPDRYVFTKLWQRLKDKGWSWCKAKNRLDDYWYIKPASIRPESEWMRGMDYFVTEDEVIDFCKQRDLHSMRDRERRRKERLLERERKTSAAATAEAPSHQAASKKPTKKEKPKKESKPKKSSSDARVAAPEHPKKPEAASKKRPNKGSTGEDKRGKPRKKPKAAEPANKKRRTVEEGVSVRDKNLKVEAHSNRAPWAKSKPRYEHRICVNATAMTWVSSFYYLPGEHPKNFTIRFQSVEGAAQHFALHRGTVVWASGEASPANEEERCFARLIRYALVPGMQSHWTEIRRITRKETEYLLNKIGYRLEGTHWIPPVALAGYLQPRYESLESLCEALRCLDGDLQAPPTAASRRRKQESKITAIQLMALRLRMAEDFSESEEEEEKSKATDSEDSLSVVSEEANGKKKRKREKERKETAAASPEVKNKEPNGEEEQHGYLSPSEQKKKDFAEDEEQQLAMSPSKIKVGEFRKNPQDNTAPWAVNPPVAPKGGWTKLYFRMGMSYHNGNYYLPGESFRNYTHQFSKVDDIKVHICKEGSYDQYLDKLDSSKEREFVTRHFNYGNVPGGPYEWRKLRQLNLQETVLFLSLLGFEKKPGKYGWWSIPEGVPILEEKSYPTFCELCKALVRLPDLEDRTMGMGNRRRSRKKEEDLVLSDYQMMALRLRLAEGFEEDGKVEKVIAEELDRKLLFDSDVDDLIDRLMPDNSDHSNAWKALQNLGCTFSGGYRVPGKVEVIDSQNGVIEYILEHSVKDLDWEHCTLDATEVDDLENYIKAFHSRCVDVSLVKEALNVTTKKNIRTYLGKISIDEKYGKYYIGDMEYSEFEIVNMIRSSGDLYSLCQNVLTPTKLKRRRSDDPSLSKLEATCIRIWAALSNIPLTNMPDPSIIGQCVNDEPENHEGKQMETCSTFETPNPRDDDHREVNGESPLAPLTSHRKHEKTTETTEANRPTTSDPPAPTNKDDQEVSHNIDEESSAPPPSDSPPKAGKSVANLDSINDQRTNPPETNAAAAGDTVAMDSEVIEGSDSTKDLPLDDTQQVAEAPSAPADGTAGKTVEMDVEEVRVAENSSDDSSKEAEKISEDRPPTAEMDVEEVEGGDSTKGDSSNDTKKVSDARPASTEGVADKNVPNYATAPASSRSREVTVAQSNPTEQHSKAGPLVDLTTPPPQKKPRKSTSSAKRRRTDDGPSSSSRLPNGAGPSEEFFTPREHNVDKDLTTAETSPQALYVGYRQHNTGKASATAETSPQALYVGNRQLNTGKALTTAETSPQALYVGTRQHNTGKSSTTAETSPRALYVGTQATASSTAEASPQALYVGYRKPATTAETSPRALYAGTRATGFLDAVSAGPTEAAPNPSRTAASHEQAFGRGAAAAASHPLRTQPSFESTGAMASYGDANLRDMSAAAELDFNPEYSPMPVSRTHQRCYGRSQEYHEEEFEMSEEQREYQENHAHQQYDAEFFLTQEDPIDDGTWFDNDLL